MDDCGRRCRGDRGAALVEFGLVLPILVALLLGIIDFGMAFNDSLNLKQGVRDGAREGAVANFGDSTTCNGLATETGSVQAKRLICTTRDHIGLDAGRMRVGICLRSADGASCSSSVEDYAEGGTLVVCGMYPVRSRSGFFAVVAGDRALTTRVAIRIEQLESEFETVEDDLVTAFEAALEGQTWDFCEP